MKIEAKVTPYSSVVGGGVTLLDETGRAIAQMPLLNTFMEKAEYVALSEHIAAAINAGQPERQVRYLNRGSIYDVVGSAEMQISRPSEPAGMEMHPTTKIREGDKLTIYRAHDGGKLYARFLDEMNDGRFEEIS